MSPRAIAAAQSAGGGGGGGAASHPLTHPAPASQLGSSDSAYPQHVAGCGPLGTDAEHPAAPPGGHHENKFPPPATHAASHAATVVTLCHCPRSLWHRVLGSSTHAPMLLTDASSSQTKEVRPICSAGTVPTTRAPTPPAQIRN